MTGCEWVDANSPKCGARAQSLRYEVVSGATFPNVASPSGGHVSVDVDKLTGQLSFASDDSGQTTPDYEQLIFPDEEVHCDLGAPVRSGVATDSMYRWIGRFPNGVGGICRAFDNDLKKNTGKKQTASYLDACLLYTSPSPRDRTRSRMPSSA